MAKISKKKKAEKKVEKKVEKKIEKAEAKAEKKELSVSAALAQKINSIMRGK